VGEYVNVCVIVCRKWGSNSCGELVE